MAGQDRKERQRKFYVKKCREILRELPSYLSEYDKAMKEEISPVTRHTYLGRIRAFLEYLSENEETLSGIPVKEMPLYAFTDRTEKDILDFLDSSISPKSSDTYRRLNVTALSSFYRYLISVRAASKDPCAEISFKRTIKRPPNALTKIDGDKFISDILRNDRILIRYKDGNGKENAVIRDISTDERIKRERQVPRNALIIALFLYTSLTPDEMAGLDVQDVDTVSHTVTVRSTGRTVTYGSEAAAAFSRYLVGEPLPDDIISRQTDPDPADFLMFCRDNMDNPAIEKTAAKRFGRQDAAFLSDVRECAKKLRAGGRKAFLVPETETALFVTSRKKRISDRMIRYMIKDLSLTYLPRTRTGKNGLTASSIRKIRESAVLKEDFSSSALSGSMGIQEAWAKQKVAAYRKGR